MDRRRRPAGEGLGERALGCRQADLVRVQVEPPLEASPTGGTLAAGASSELTWFYAAGATADLSAVAQAIASAAAPVAPRVTRGNGAATLSWDAPESTDPIVNYTIRYKKTTDATWTNVPLRNPASTATSEIISGLQNGSTYTFQVAAISHSVSANIDVTGAWSATSLPALIGYPDAPTVTGATSWVSEPMKTSSSITVRCLLAPS